MATEQKLAYVPDYAVPPGETLLETLATLGISQAELAERTGRPTKTINEIIKGKAAITPETALQLERALGVPAAFWNNRERQYRETLARLQEREGLQKVVKWLKGFPVAAMAKCGWIEASPDKVSQVQELLNFFGVASPDQWNGVWGQECAQFRKPAAFPTDRGALAAWLRKGELEARDINCEPYNDDVFRAALQSVRGLTGEVPDIFVREIRQMCARGGVAVVFVPELPKTRASGATRWLTPQKALIQLSLRYKTDDHLWFTVFHEAGHIVLHGKRDIFLESGTPPGDVTAEKEADRFAEDVLILRAEWNRFEAAGLYDRQSIANFARVQGIVPGIVVGRLQHAGLIPYNRLNDLKRRFRWGD
jgi:addiction module HigA family antidote